MYVRACMCVYGRHVPEIITQIHQSFHFYTMMSNVYERAFIFKSLDDSDTYSIMSGFYYSTLSSTVSNSVPLSEEKGHGRRISEPLPAHL